jgi:uncharacterized protein (DUF4415 family)
MPASKRSMDPDWFDEDDAPDLATPEYRKKFAAVPVKRGRPKLIAPKQLVSLRLDADVIASFRSSGPGWQTRAARILKEAIQSGLPMAVSSAKSKPGAKRALLVASVKKGSSRAAAKK